MSLLSLNNVSLVYQSDNAETQTLKSVNINIEEGEFVSIVGPSGCGKTTMLSLIAGIIEPTSGYITLDGKKICGVNENIKYMFQKDHLFDWRTIEQNLNLGLEIEYLNTKKRNKSAKENYFAKKDYALNLLDKYGLGEFKDHYPPQLSGGMRQRVALIRTLALNPRLLLLDEPFSAIDFQNRLLLCNDVSRIIKSEKKTAILVTHDIHEAISMSDKVNVMTKRPATVKNIHKIELGSATPLEKRDLPEFNKYFNIIWEELINE